MCEEPCVHGDGVDVGTVGVDQGGDATVFLSELTNEAVCIVVMATVFGGCVESDGLEAGPGGDNDDTEGDTV